MMASMNSETGPTASGGPATNGSATNGQATNGSATSGSATSGSVSGKIAAALLVGLVLLPLLYVAWLQPRVYGPFVLVFVLTGVGVFIASRRAKAGRAAKADRDGHVTERPGHTGR